MTREHETERYMNAISIARDHGGQLVTVKVEPDWEVGDYIDQGEWVGFLVVSISDSGEAVLLR